MGAGGDADDARTDRAHYLAGAHVRAHGELVRGAGVTVVDVAVTAHRAVAVQHRRPRTEAADPVKHDRAAAHCQLGRVTGRGDVDALVERPGALRRGRALRQWEGE